MRAIKPWIGHLLAFLLLMQWGGGSAACLQAMAWDPGQVLCHAAGPAPDHAPPDLPVHSPVPGSTAAAGCPMCAPLQPSLLPVLPDVPAPRPAVVLLGAVPPATKAALIAAILWPQQPRAPPVPA